MRALDPEVMDIVWNAVEGLLPDRPDSHRLGCHRKRISDRLSPIAHNAILTPSDARLY